MLKPTKVMDIPAPFVSYQWRAALLSVPERYHPHVGNVQLKEFRTEYTVFWEYEMTVHNKKRKKVGEIRVKDDKPQFRLRWQDADGLYRFHTVSEREFRSHILGWFAK